MTKKNTTLLTLVLVMGFLVGCGAKIPNVDWTLKISGEVATPMEFSFADLAKMDQTDLNDIMMEKSTGEDEITSWSGVKLDDILVQAGAADDYVSITAIASDGYSIEIAKEELTGAIVALKNSEEWIVTVTPDKGPIRLVTPLTPANRWVFGIVELQVNK
ncbi:MAG: molybdopterin-dependent oxidoreductase [Chloroflexi bacterium]|nr:molybdopterin-dependent oxidoreductase [Chloroflexota bacterium]